MEKKKKEEEDNGLCLGRCRGRREEEGWEMLESCKSMTQNDYTRVKREKIYEASPWKRMASFFTSLPPFIHPFLPLFALLLDCSFGQPKLFLFSAERRKLIIYMFQSVLKSECNLPPLPPPSFILSLIHRSQHQLWGMFLNCSPHLTFTVAIFVFFFMLDIKCTDFGSASAPKPN